MDPTQGHWARSPVNVNDNDNDTEGRRGEVGGEETARVGESVCCPGASGFL